MSTAREIIRTNTEASFTAGFNLGALMGLQSVCAALSTFADMPQFAKLTATEALRFTANALEQGGNLPFKADDETAEIAPLVDAAIAALSAAGWQIVPAEPKEETIRRMIVKMLGSSLGGGYGWPEYARDLYMIAAAPLPPPPAKQGG